MRYNCRTNRRASSHPGIAETGAPGNSSNQPIGAPLTIRLMPMPSIMPPTREPMTPAETPSQMMSARETMAEWYGGGRASTSPIA